MDDDQAFVAIFFEPHHFSKGPVGLHRAVATPHGVRPKTLRMLLAQSVRYPTYRLPPVLLQNQTGVLQLTHPVLAGVLNQLRQGTTE